MFEIKHRDGLARICSFETAHGIVETPAILPVINPNKLVVPPKKLKDEFGAQIIITNSYVIKQSEELRNKALKDGLHELLDHDGPIMTDSGTFQAYVYGSVDTDPEEILRFQKNIGSDIITILDRFTEPEDSKELVEEKIRDTLQRAEDAVEKYGRSEIHLSLPIQGSIFTGLRTDAAEGISKLDAKAVYPIGGVVPLMEDYRFKDLAEVIIASKKGLGPKGPVHLFGAGHPMIFSLSVLLGCDMFDSSSYIKYARRGDFMFPTGTRKLENMYEITCDCPSCNDRTVEDFRQMDEDKRTKLIAEHNLRQMFVEIREIKQAIRDGSLWELVERRCRSHPQLYEVFEILKKQWRYLEGYEPRSRKSALMYTGVETLDRPAVKRVQGWIMNEYEPHFDAPTFLFKVNENEKPYNRHLMFEISEIFKRTEANLLLSTPMGPVPMELDEIYPIAQSIFPRGMRDEKLVDEYLEKKGIDDVLVWDGIQTLSSVENGGSANLDVMRVKTVADYQFGKGAGNVLTDGQLRFVKNRKGRVKNVILDDQHILSVRHYDGFFTLKTEGAEILKEHFSLPNLRVKVDDDSAEFNRKGRNVFSKFVLDVDKGLRPGDEALIVDKDDNMVAVGRVFLTKDEMLEYDTGMAVRVREGLEN
ncbi:MAG: tRNA guanosine(15) transglycosylase TgtA, partial [Candidatus Saliniplasma sp.]